MPDLPEGSHRTLLLRLHRLYTLAGLPSTRTISRTIRRHPSSPPLETVSHETVSALLRGAPLPAWSKIRSIIIVLCEGSERPVLVGDELAAGVELWSAAHRGAGSPPVRQSPPPAVEPAPPPRFPEPVQAAAAAPAPPVVHGPLPERDPFFVGRETPLDMIRKSLSRDPNSPLVIYGPIGSGKSQLVREYVTLHAGEYAVVWWIDAGDADRATACLLELAKRLGIGLLPDRKQMLDRLFAFLAGSHHYLLVFDGVRDDAIRALIRTVGGSVIVTTRDAAWARDYTHADIEVPDFDAGEVMQYLRKRDPHMTALQTGQLVELVGAMPLALEEACRAYAGGAISWEDLPTLLTDGSRLARHLTRTTAAARAALGLITTDRVTVRLLTLLIGFGPSPVWVPMLAAGARGDVSAELRITLTDQIGLRRRIPALVRLGLARRGPEDSIEIPPLLRLVLRELLPDATAERNRDDVREILIAADPAHPDDRRTWPTHRGIAPHVHPSGLLQWHRTAAYRTVHHQIRYLFLSDDLARARRLGRDAEAALAGHRTLTHNDELALQIRRDYANALRADGHYRDAEALTAEAMDRVGDDPAYTGHPLALDLARSRGHDLRIAGDYQRALALDDDTYQRHRRIFPDEDYRTAASRYNRSVSLRILGRFADALAGDEAECTRLRNGFDGGDRAMHRVLNAIGEDLYGLGRYREAVDRLTPVLEQATGRDLLRARRTTGVALRRLGDAGGAAERLGGCHQACTAQLGAARELTIAAAMSFANALRECRQLPAALQFGELAVMLYQQAMGPANPLVHAARVNLASTLIAMGRAVQAEQTAQDAHDALRDRLGAGHPFTVAAAANHASAVALTDPAAAQGLAETAYREARALYGDAHPDTLLTAANFAADRARRHEGDGTHPSMDVVLGGLRRTLGAQHPAVLRVAEGDRALLCIEPPSA